MNNDDPDDGTALWALRHRPKNPPKDKPVDAQMLA